MLFCRLAERLSEQRRFTSEAWLFAVTQATVSSHDSERLAEQRPEIGAHEVWQQSPELNPGTQCLVRGQGVKPPWSWTPFHIITSWGDGQLCSITFFFAEQKLVGRLGKHGSLVLPGSAIGLKELNTVYMNAKYVVTKLLGWPCQRVSINISFSYRLLHRSRNGKTIVGVSGRTKPQHRLFYDSQCTSLTTSLNTIQRLTIKASVWTVTRPTIQGRHQ